MRGYLNYRPDPQVLVYGIGGYEWNDYYFSESSNPVYGAGGEWRCDLHPRHSRNGRLIVIDGPHAGGRQLHLLDVSEVVG